jgi:geranylgeranyl pyrophosphate synthase
VQPAQRRLIEMVLEDRDFARVSPGEILELVRAEGTLEETETLAEEHAAAAKQELQFFPPSDARDALEFAPDFVLHRRS